MTLAGGLVWLPVGKEYAGEPINVEGPRRRHFIRLACENGMDPRRLPTVREVFDSLLDDPSFVRDLRVAHCVGLIGHEGPDDSAMRMLTKRG
jgi:hypothetical protein